MSRHLPLHARKAVQRWCGFLERVKEHTGTYTLGSGTYCSSCGSRIFNPNYSGSYCDEGDMSIVDRLRKVGEKIPRHIQKEISAFQDAVDWKPRWKW